MSDKLVVESTVELMISERNDCTCCPGNHVFGRGLELDDYPGRFPYRRVGDWMGLQGDFVTALFHKHGYAVHGKRVRVTLELVDG